MCAAVGVHNHDDLDNVANMTEGCLAEAYIHSTVVQGVKAPHEPTFVATGWPVWSWTIFC